MRNIYIVLLLFSTVYGKAALAQIVTGNELFAKSGTIVSLDSMVLIPSADLDLSNHSLTLMHTAIAGNPQSSINRVYVLDESLHFSGDLGIIYSPAELNGNSESILEVAGSATNENGFVTFSGSSRDVAVHYVWNTVTNVDFRMLTLVDAGAVLPVTLIAFQARKEENRVELTWKTSFETNSAYFEIQRSGNAKDWQPLGRVSSAGESSYKSSYIFEDLAPMAGDNYYRLKSVDRDGTFALSQIRKVSWDDAALTIFPNPANDVIELHVQDWQHVANIRIIDASGIILKEHHSEKTYQPGRLSLEGLCAGSYILEAQYLNGGVLRKHFIKY